MTETFHIESNSSLNPSSLKVEVKNTTIGLLTEMLENDVIDLQPDFQRKQGVWSEKEQHELIESIALQLPLPSFYFYIDPKRKKWVVIDGLQRLHAIKDFFVKKTMVLNDLEIVKHLNQQSYNDLSFFERTNLKMFPVTLNVISGDVSAYAVSLIFKRVNSAGMQLSPAEVRNALFQGQATRLTKEMAEMPVFRRLVSDHINTDRMADREYVTRYLAFLLGSFEDYNGRMDLFLSDAMKFVNTLPESTIDAIRQEFSASLCFCERLLGTDAFRIPASAKERKHPVSRALFEMLTIAFSNLAASQEENILKNKKSFMADYRAMLSEPAMKKAFTSNMASVSNIRLRFDAISALVHKYI